MIELDFVQSFINRTWVIASGIFQSKQIYCSSMKPLESQMRLIVTFDRSRFLFHQNFSSRRRMKVVQQEGTFSLHRNIIFWRPQRDRLWEAFLHGFKTSGPLVFDAVTHVVTGILQLISEFLAMYEVFN